MMGALDKITNWLFRSIPANVEGPRYSVPARLYGGFDAGGFNRFTRSWSASLVPPDELVRNHLRTLQARSRDAANNDPYMRRFIRACRANIVGTHGPRLRCSVKKNGVINTKISQAVTGSFEDWGVESADFRSVQSFHSLTLSVVSSLAIDGEAFVKIIADGPYGLQLQIIDAVRCPTDYDYNDAPSGNYIRAGIEYDSFDRPLAYYFTSDGQHGNYYALDGRIFIRVPADEMLHIYRKDFIGQKRGLPWAVASLFRLRRLKGFEENALMNAEVGASKTAVIEYQAGFEPIDDDDDNEGFEPISLTADGGQVLELEPGQKLSQWNPDFPDGSLGQFSTHLLHGISAGLGVMHSTISGDFSGVNYSSFRAGVQEERELWKEDQKLLIEEFIRPVFRAWLPNALLRNMIVSDDGSYRVKPSKLRAIRRNTTFHGRRWDWVDPKSDAAANRTAIETGVKSPQEIIRDQGKDPEETLLELSDWFRKAKELGIPLEALQVQMGAQVKITEDEGNGDGQDANNTTA